MLKGSAIIELTDIHTGAKEVVRHDNMLSNAISDILSLNPDGFNFDSTAMASTLLPVIPNLLGGILLCEAPLLAEASKYYAPQSNGIVGYADNTVNPGNDIKRGSLNQTESGKLEDGTGYRFVFDFTTSQANGTISALGLTSRWGGMAGRGSALQRASTLIQLSEAEQSWPTGVGYWDVMKAVGITSLAPEKNEAYSLYVSDTKEISLFVLNAKLTAWDLFSTTGYALHNVKRTITIKPANFASTVTSTTRFYTFVDGGDGYIWGFEHANNTDGNTAGNASVNWIKISKDDFSFSEGTWSLSAQLLSFGSVSPLSQNPPTVTTHCVIHDGFLYCVQNAREGIYKISLANPSDIIYIPSENGLINTSVVYYYSSGNTGRYYYTGTVFNILGDSVYCANGFIEGARLVSATSSFPAEGTTNTPYGLRRCAKPGLRCGPFLIGNSFLYGSRSSSNGGPYLSSHRNVWLMAPYLATINNLDEPVAKNADKTMKIIYIIRESAE